VENKGAAEPDARGPDAWHLATILLCPLAIVVCFVALAIVCDEYLAPALELLVERLGVPHDVASATFLALGSSAPEISINCMATLHGKVEMSLGAVLGSGVIAYTVIPASCVLVSRGQVLRLELIPLVRDVTAFSISTLLFVAFTVQGEFTTGKDSLLVGLFFVYLLVLKLLSRFYHSPDVPEEAGNGGGVGERTQLLGDAPARGDGLAHGHDHSHGQAHAHAHAHANVHTHAHAHAHEHAHGLHGAVRVPDAIDEVALERAASRAQPGKGMSKYNTIGADDLETVYKDKAPLDVAALDAEREVQSAETCFGAVLGGLAAPLRTLFRVTIPPFCPAEKEPEAGHGDEDDEGGIELGDWWPVTLAVSILYVCALSELVLLLTTAFSHAIGLPDHIAGLTILALGAQIPDLFASIAVARKGEGPSSIANAIGSQIISVLFGVGFPFLLYNLHFGKPILVDVSSRGASGGAGGLAAVGATLCLLVVVFVVLCFRHVRPHAHASELRKPSLNDVDAVVLFALYGISLVVLIVAER
jgi:Ca2+/Na+ antiporter